MSPTHFFDQPPELIKRRNQGVHANTSEVKIPKTN